MIQKFLIWLYNKLKSKPEGPFQAKPDGASRLSNDCLINNCFVETQLPLALWRKAYDRALELYYKNGKPPGLYPYKWDALEQTAIAYHYDLLNFSEKRLGLFGYVVETSTMHFGIVDTDTEKSVANNQNIWELHKIFRAELLGLDIPFAVEQKR